MKEITLQEALSLVRFKYYDSFGWQVCDVPGIVHGDVLEVEGNVFNGVGGNVNGNVYGNVYGKVGGDVEGGIGGNVYGKVGGGVYGKVGGDVYGTIKCRKWQFVETPKEKLQRLITESGNQELIDTFNQLEDN